MQQDVRSGLCPLCAFSRRVGTARGTQFLLCARSKLEPEFVRYPPQPVLRCRGFNDRFGDREAASRADPGGSP